VQTTLTWRPLLHKLFWLVLLSIFPAASAFSQLPAQASSAARLQKFATDLDSVRHLLAIPGMSAAVVEGDRIIWRQNFGLADVTKKIPVTDSTEFCIASVSKTMAAVVLMQLVQATPAR
jgi:CubicO group peptidase (beta-lactamase class C family)